MFRNLIIFMTAAAVCVTTATAGSEEREDIHRTFTLAPGGTVEVHNINGNVTIDAWDESHVDLEAVKKTRYGRDELDRIKVEIEETGNSLVVRTVHQRYDDEENDSFFGRIFSRMSRRNPRGSVDYTLRIPRDMAQIVAKSINGTVKLDGTGGESEASTTNGSVVVENVDGYVSARTTNGNVHVNGTPRIREAKTTNGNVDVSLAPDYRDPVTLRTTNGSISIALDPGMDADLNIRTVNGSINAAGFRVTLDKISKKELRGSLGNGGMEIDASTVNGSVSLIPR